MSTDPELFPFTTAVLVAVSGAKTESMTAPQAIRLAAEYLRRREVLPPMLADYLADAFEVAACKECPEDQMRALAEELGITIRGRRPANVSAWDVASFVDDLANGKSERQRIIAAVKHFGISKTPLEKRLKEGRVLLAEYYAINDREPDE